MIRAALLCLILAGGAVAQDAQPAQLNDVSSKLAAATDALETASEAGDQVAALTGIVRAYEDALIAVTADLRRVTAKYDDLRTALDAQQDDVGQLLTVLQTISRRPAPLTVLHPDGAAGTVRSGMISAEMPPALQAKVAALQSDLAAIADAKEQKYASMDQLRDGLDGLRAAHAALQQALQDRAPLPSRFTEDPVEIALLAATAPTLGVFADALEQLYGAGLPNDSTLAAKGVLPLPTTGRVLQGFEAPDTTGVTHQGILIATPPRALVVAPTSATILFRGPILTFENVVVIEPTAGVLMIFAGLEDVIGTAGDILPAGAPIGIMGGQMPRADANLTINNASDGGSASQALYLEVRDRQTPINPATWFALEQQMDDE